MPFAYTGIMREIVHHFKFYGREDLAFKLGLRSFERLNWKIKTISNPLIIPVPLHRLRVRERGYDQVLSLAKGFAKDTGWEIRSDLIRRVKHSRSQSRLTFKERLTNVRNIFELTENKETLKDRTIVLVDDVIHSGSTMLGCIQILYSAKIRDIYLMAACG